MRNFSTDHLDGDVTAEILGTSLGGGQHGVLTEYRAFPDYVRVSLLLCFFLALTGSIISQSLVKIPEHLSYEEASTLCRCAALTAYNAHLGPKPVKAGDTVLVLGTGGVSMCVCSTSSVAVVLFFDDVCFGLQLAVASGATVIATSSSDAKLAIAKKLGAAHTINYNTTPDWDKEVLWFTEGRGVDHILEVGLVPISLQVRF